MLCVSQHPARARLHAEVHERPPEPTSAPLALSHIVMVCDAPERQQSRAHLAALLRLNDSVESVTDATHMRVDIGELRVRWELHTEFVSWTFSRGLADDALHADRPPSGLAGIPYDWLAGLPGKCLVAVQLWVIRGDAGHARATAAQLLNDGQCVGSAIDDGLGMVFTDLEVRPDGFLRMVLSVEDMEPRQVGRYVQRLLEIETYRIMALQGLPVARNAATVLSAAEDELAALASAIRCARRDDERQLLDRLTRLAAEIEGEYAATHSRFSATAAYFELVDKRVHELGETRLPGLQTIGEFLDRRLSPARSTCVSAVRRQEGLSQRVARVSSLLRTRVEIEQQLGSQSLLTAMNRRQGMQLQLQIAVEGLSVAAITYYIVGLIGYLAKGVLEFGWPFSVEATAASCVPVVAFVVWWSMRHTHRAFSKAVKNHDVNATAFMGEGTKPGELRGQHIASRADGGLATPFNWLSMRCRSRVGSVRGERAGD